MSALHLLRGDDEVLLGEATTDLVHRLVGGGDRGPDGDGLRRRRLPPRAPSSTPPRRRLSSPIAGWSWGGASTASPPTSSAPLFAYLAEPLDTTDLVLDGVGGARCPRRCSTP